MELHLVTGDDELLVGNFVTTLVDKLVGDRDRNMVLETYDETNYCDEEGEYHVVRLTDPVQTPSMLADKRVVVGRHASRLQEKEHIDSLVAMLATPLDFTDLVIVWERGMEPTMSKLPVLPKALVEAVKKAGGEVHNVGVPKQKKAASEWLVAQLDESQLTFETGAVAAIQRLVGEDRSRVIGLLRTFAGALGADATVTAEDVEIYGGSEQGKVVPWALDDAIDKGDITESLDVVGRLVSTTDTLTERKESAFRQVAMMHRRFASMLKLDGSGARTPERAATILGIAKPTFVTQKLLRQSHKMGFAKLSRAIGLLSTADLQLRGTIDWPPELIMEVLVARLASLNFRPRR